MASENIVKQILLVYITFETRNQTFYQWKSELRHFIGNQMNLKKCYNSRVRHPLYTLLGRPLVTWPKPTSAIGWKSILGINGFQIWKMDSVSFMNENNINLNRRIYTSICKSINHQNVRKRYHMNVSKVIQRTAILRKVS